MTDQPDEGHESSTPADPTSPLDFDPYRYGKPDYPVPPEYAPPGYVAPTPAPPAYPPTQPTAQQPIWPPTDDKQQPPPPPQYGAYRGYAPHPPPPPGYPAYGMVQQTNGKATAAMVLGIVSIPLFFLSFLDLGLAIPAIVLGAIGLRDAKRNPQRGGRGKALAGVICGSIGLLFIIILLVVVISRIAPCFHSGGGVSQSCVNDHL
jgi:hypothetical protein